MTLDHALPAYESLAIARRVSDLEAAISSDRGSAAAPSLVSVVTIVRNGAPTLRRTIESVLGQTYPRIEYIVVDGESTDGSIEIIKEYDDQIAYWISEPDRGISDAFNKGVALSRGAIIGLINSDDWLEEDAVQTVVEEFKKMGDKAIVHGMMQLWKGPEKDILIAGNHDLLTKDMTINHPTVFATAGCYQNFGLFRLDFRIAMDYEWLLRARAGGAEFSYLPKVLAHMSAGGVSKTDWLGAIKDGSRAKSLHVGRFRARIYFCSQVVKSLGRKTLKKSGLGFIVDHYHRRFSLVKKTKKQE